MMARAVRSSLTCVKTHTVATLQAEAPQWSSQMVYDRTESLT